MHLKRLLYTPLGKVFISILLGLGLATAFRRVCNDKNCIVFNGPILSEIDGKTYKYGDKCYKYSAHPEPCNKNKRIIELRSQSSVIPTKAPLFGASS